MSEQILDNAKELDVKKALDNKDRFRVTIYGSARIKKDDEVYKQTFDLAKRIGLRGYDVITGGGPGLMEAANAGHTAGDKDDKVQSIGLRIELDFEQTINEYVEFKSQFERFAERLETFATLSNVFVLVPGGVGTMLELFYTWQLVQVKKMEYKPIILIGAMWERLIYWVIDYALKDNLISSSDFDYIYIAKDNDEAMKLIDAFNEQYKKDGKLSPIEQYKSIKRAE